MNNIKTNKPLLICEGEIDCLSAVECGYPNAVSVPMGSGNFQWIDENWEWLDSFDEFIIAGDNDIAGLKMQTEILPRLGEHKCRLITYPKQENGQPINDLNEILYRLGKEKLYKTIINAIDTPIKRVVNLADVKKIDLLNYPGIKSGIKVLDKLISRFFMGSYVVWTGMTGMGKSTIINQVCIAEPIDQGFKTFIFSGELSKNLLKSWIDSPIAGAKNVQAIYRDDEPTLYQIKPEIEEKINAWYDKRIWIYEDEIDTTAKTVLSTMESLAKKYGVKNFVIDNLMTVDTSGYKGEKPERDTAFVLDLKKFAIKHNVVVHLVAHRRKTSEEMLNLQDISGTFNLINLAHFAFAIHKVSDKQKEGIYRANGDEITAPINADAILQVFKNRYFGLHDLEIELNYDASSRKFYKTNEELNKRYGWDTSEPTATTDTIIEGEGSPF